MAEKKRSSTGSKSSGKARSTGARTSAAANKAAQRKPVRREVGAFVCLFLAAFTLLGLFNIDAVFLSLTRDLFRGLLGAGIYVMPFALLLDFVILLFHDGRPVRLRVASTVAVALSVVFWPTCWVRQRALTGNLPWWASCGVPASPGNPAA